MVPGVRVWRNPGNAFVGVLLHFTADPEGADEATRRSGMDTNVYNRENNLNFAAFAGKPVYASFTDAHVSELAMPIPDVPVLRSFDLGYHHPAVVYAQLLGDRLWVLGELMGEDVTLDRFLDDFVAPYEAVVFPEGAKYIDSADPAGRQVNDKSNFNSFAILSNHGVFPLWRRSEINEGLAILRKQLELPDGFLIHPRCRLLIQGFKGGYRYPEDGKQAAQFPVKDGYFDHTMDALRYLVVNNMTLNAPPAKSADDEPDPPFWREALRKRQHGDDYEGWD